MDYKKFRDECRRMQNLKNNDVNIQKVYSDVNFLYLERDCQDYEDSLKLADAIFEKNVSQFSCAVEPDRLRPKE